MSSQNLFLPPNMFLLSAVNDSVHSKVLKDYTVFVTNIRISINQHSIDLLQPN
jgi:hypothetical protein